MAGNAQTAANARLAKKQKNAAPPGAAGQASKIVGGATATQTKTKG